MRDEVDRPTNDTAFTADRLYGRGKEQTSLSFLGRRYSRDLTDVEVAPAYDQAEITALAAATLAHDWLCLLAAQKSPKP